MKYVKDKPRIVVKFIDNNTDETLFEISDRNWLNVGQLFPSSTVDNIVKSELRKKELPNSILVIAVAEYNLSDDD